MKPGRFSLARVEGYTDAVFAIAATLLVLDLTTSALGRVRSDAQMWGALAELWPNAMAFVISFLLLSMLWVIHLQQFRFIGSVDGGMVWINNIRLLFVVLIPFTTSLNAEFNGFFAGRMLLPINFFLAALAGWLSWVWAAARDGHLLRDDPDRGAADRREQSLGGVSAVVCGAVAAIVSPWLGSIGFLAYAANPLLERVLVRAASRRAGRG